MKLCMTILVRDEEDLIRANLEYHLSRGVDFIIATDNRSQDGTADILREYEKRGLLHYIFEPDDDYSQDIWVTKMAKIAAKEYGADWVMHVDADEFWWPLGSEKIPDILEAVDCGTDGLIVPRSNFIPIENYDDRAPFFTQLTIREKQSLNSLGRPLPPKVCHRGTSEIRISQGNHSFGLETREPLTKECDEILIFHFQKRGFKQFQKRIQQGGSAYDRNKRLDKNVGETWRKLYDLDQRGELQEYYNAATYSEEDVRQGIFEKSLVPDTRFMHYMNKLYNQIK